MPIGVYFDVKGMTAETYAAIHDQLVAEGVGEPDGRVFHAGFSVGDDIQVFDIWESHQQFEAFGRKLMPILAEHRIDPGTPRIGTIERVIRYD